MSNVNRDNNLAPQTRRLEYKSSEQMQRRLITCEEAAAYCGVPTSTVYGMCREGRIGGIVRLGRLIRIDLAKLEQWLEAGGQALEGGWRKETA